MAIYHLSVKVISRADGRSAVAAAAYRAAEALPDDRLGRTHDFTHKAGVIHSEILLPEGAPARLLDRATLWNAVEAGEKRKDAQLVREIEISLPRELSQPEAIRLAQDFVREQFVAHGMVADLNVHLVRTASGEEQLHAHVMLTMRGVGPDGFGKKVREWNRTEVLVGWRERWAALANERLAEQGHDIRVDHRSLAAQGIGLEPQNKIGPAGARREARGEDAERAAEHDGLARRNGERIISDPSLVLGALARQQSTFTRRDLARLVDRHTADADQFAAAMAKVEASPALVRLGADGRGQERFTTREMLAAEQRMEQAAGALAEREGHRVDLRRRFLESPTLGREQVLAFRHVTQAQDLSVVVGYAGTGKSTMLGEARAAWEAEGLRVRGAALSGIAAEQLEAGAGIASRTVHSLLFQWEQGREALTARDVLVVDEAGMIGSRQMERLLSQAQAAGAKVVLVGDPEQLQAIEAGAAFRAIAERVGAVEITEVRRQREGWQQQATRELATGRTAEALARYEAAGMVRGHATLDAAKAAVIAGWDAARQEAPEARQIMLAYRREDVRDLNERARAVRQAAGELGADYRVQTEHGERAFAAGERVYFLRNERSLGVKNGTLGTVTEIGGSASRTGPAPGRGERLVVRLDDGRSVGFDVKDYAHIDHGYAATVHKSQGVTVDRTHVLASSHMDRHAAYVGLSRHRERVDLHWSADQVGSRERLALVLGRERLKDTSLDYALAGGTQAEPELPGETRGSARAYAERRGLVPESEIVLREPVAEVARGEPARPRRGMFAGLKLDAGRAEAGPAHVVAPAVTKRDRGVDWLGPSVGDYARAWSDAERMRQAGLPVLPHQTAALAHADRALDGQLPGFGQDLQAALTQAPRLAEGAGTDAGLAALIEAGRAARGAREKLEARAREAVRAWGKLERAYEQAGKKYDHLAQREIGGRLERFAKELKRDPQLDSVLRQRGQQLGVTERSRLARVVQSRGDDNEVTHELGLRHSRGLGLGR
ncbi:MAG: Ti-type conjugative transfer relaxase TraA [Proteobacteria bacterium]|nr:Ti-type conjugative transfer relaxase TraA [Pseudomonadota bacterium]